MLAKESPDTVFSASATSTPETLCRSLSLWNSLTIGFATVSPVAGLYAIIGVQTVVTGGGWFSALALCLVMQLLVATVYAELSSQIPIAGGAYKWARQLGGATTGTYAGAIYVSSTIAMLTTTAYTGGIWLAIFFGSGSETGVTLVIWGAVFMLICTILNLVHVSVFKFLISLGVYAEIVGSFGVALLLFFFFRQHEFSELFARLGTGTAPSPTAAFLAALAISGWAFIGFDACSTIAEETHEPKRMVPRAIFFSLCMVGSVVLFNSAALTLSFNRDTLIHTSAASDPVTPVIVDNFGTWAETPFLAIVMIAFLACGSSMVQYTSRIVFSMAREGSMPAVLSRVTAAGAPHNAVLFTVSLATRDNSCNSSFFFIRMIFDSSILLITAFFVNARKEVSDVMMTMLITAVIFALASLPTFLWLQERAVAQPGAGLPVCAAFAQLRETLRTAHRYRDLRRFLVQQIEAHVERRLITAPMLES